MYKDLREFIEAVDKIGELKRLEGADWNLEVGAVGAMSNDAVLFDKLKGYPPGYRILVNMISPVSRWLLSMGWETKAKENELCREFKDRLLAYKPVPAEWVKKGPVQENVQEGKDVDLFKFPVPKIHPKDGGRYIGNADAIMMRDPDTGMVNFGTYRMQAFDKNTTALYISSAGKDGSIILRKYQERKIPCPVVALVGIEPTIFYAATSHIPHIGGAGEYDFAGWLKGQAIPVVKGEFTGLPIPAFAEIALEGESLPGETRLEGPFGEWTGYSEPRQSYVMHVRRVLHRNDPILTIQSPSAPTRPPGKGGLIADPRVGAFIWEQMERAGIREIKGVAVYGTRFLEVVAIKNSYAGHSRQAAAIATQCHAGAFMGKYTIVVDDDIDPYNLDQVMWAVIRRADPQRAIEIMRNCWSDSMDCSLPLEVRTADVPLANVYNSRCNIDACKPVEWDPNLKGSVLYSPEMEAKIARRWGKVLFPKGRAQSLGWGI